MGRHARHQAYDLSGLASCSRLLHCPPLIGTESFASNQQARGRRGGCDRDWRDDRPRCRVRRADLRSVHESHAVHLAATASAKVHALWLYFIAPVLGAAERGVGPPVRTWRPTQPEWVSGSETQPAREIPSFEGPSN